MHGLSEDLPFVYKIIPIKEFLKPAHADADLFTSTFIVLGCYFLLLRALSFH